MDKLLPILKVGDGALGTTVVNRLEESATNNCNLRKKSLSVEEIQDKRIQELIDSLIFTANEVNGVGIAAPQVNQQHRLFIVASRPNIRYPNAPLMEPTAMINPKIVGHSDEIVDGWEGCLSVPGVRGLVPRYREVDVEYTDRYGKLVSLHLTDFVARIFQHEYDHLEGILFIDRVQQRKNLIGEEEYQSRAINSL